MRRVLTFLTAAVLLLVSLGIGVFTADLPFWKRALQLPLPADGAYLPVASIGAAGTPPPQEAAPAIDAFDALVVEESVNRAQRAGSRALLVTYRGSLAIERYFLTDDAGTSAACRTGGKAVGRHGGRCRTQPGPHRIAQYTRRALPARVGRRTARQDHRAATPRGNQWPGDGGRHRRPAVSLAMGRSGEPAGIRDLQGRAHVVRQRFRIECPGVHARARTRRFLQPFTGEHAARGGHRRTRHRRAVRDLRR